MGFSPMGYTGGKTKLLDRLHLPLVLADSRERYVEPFVGGGSVALNEMSYPRMSIYWINDLDSGVYAFWRAVKDSPEYLKKLVRDYKPRPEDFKDLRDFLVEAPHEFVDDAMVAQTGFVKLVIQKTTFCCLGVRAPGARGGSVQKGIKIDDNWNPKEICKKIDKCHDLLTAYDVRITNLDWAEVLGDDAVPSFVYLDPPYCSQGVDLYQHSFGAIDHQRLASALRGTKHLWLLSYDDCPTIRELYSWAAIKEIEVQRKITTTRTARELLIAPHARLLRYLDG
jgi:DNA adenine methylase